MAELRPAARTGKVSDATWARHTAGLQADFSVIEKLNFHFALHFPFPLPRVPRVSVRARQTFASLCLHHFAPANDPRIPFMPARLPSLPLSYLAADPIGIATKIQ
jgi:hypothetical protein